MATFAPALHKFSLEVLQSVKANDESIEYPFDNHPFSAVTFNLGPTALTKPHRDTEDHANNWCAVTSLGNFDHTKGGHIVFWDLLLAIEFPPYSTIFFPSALLAHSNIAIQPGEQRSSITQYTSNGLFRWVAYDHSLQGERTSSGKEWWDEPVHMFQQ